MSEYTQNLNLIKPAQDEQYNIDDFNDNFDKIDDFAGIVPPVIPPIWELSSLPTQTPVATSGVKPIK